MPRAKDHKGRQWMRAQEAAKMLGVTRPTVVAMAARDELRKKTIGGLLFVNRVDVEAKAADQAAV